MSISKKIFVGVVSLAFVAVVAIGPSTLSAPLPKAEICHNNHTISVSENALPAHLAHGDAVGACTD